MLVQFGPTCVFGPLEDGGDLVALGGVTLGSDSSCAHSHRAFVSFDPTQESCRRTSTVCHLRVSVVRLWSCRNICTQSNVNRNHMHWFTECCMYVVCTLLGMQIAISIASQVHSVVVVFGWFSEYQS